MNINHKNGGNESLCYRRSFDSNESQLGPCWEINKLRLLGSMDQK